MFTSSSLNPLSSLVLAGALAFVGAGCAASATFHSKTGRDFTAIASQAVICDEAEADAVVRAGAEPIGTVDARGLAVTATEEDVTEKAARVAAKQGGTHIVLTDRGVETFTYVQPETHEKSCTRSDDHVDCQTVDRPATVSTVDHPTAKYVVLRLAPERWASLPAPLRPVLVD